MKGVFISGFLADTLCECLARVGKMNKKLDALIEMEFAAVMPLYEPSLIESLSEEYNLYIVRDL